jgi:tetratricopeptide (TPR) repeat protein
MSAAWKHADDWLDLLEATPVLWNSFDVLDDLAAAAGGLDRFGFDTELLLPLLDRAARLFETVRAGNRVEGLRLEWRRLENRPALRLMARSAVIALQSMDVQRAIAHLEPLVLDLNPDDNHGFRNELSRCYLEQRRAQDLLSLARRYPHDVGDLAFDRALALCMLGQRAEALEALQWAHRLLPRVLPMLCRSKVRPPAGLQADQVTVGGVDEAWFYRESRRAFWLREDALELARSVSR